MSVISDPGKLLETIKQQEQLIQFDRFDNDQALALGLCIVERAKQKNCSVSVAITINGWQVFKYSMPGTPRPDNEGWLLRKHNTVTRFRQSSLATAASMGMKGATLADRALDPQEYVFFGGGFPLTVKGAGVIGSICVSALHHTEDHQLIVEACADYLGIQVPSVLSE